MQTYFLAYFFQIRCLKELISSFNSAASVLLEHLGTMADGKTEVCMYDQFARAALDVICKVKCKYLRINNNSNKNLFTHVKLKDN